MAKTSAKEQAVSNHNLLGMEVVEIRRLTDKELENLGFDQNYGNIPVVIQLQNKRTGASAALIPQMDPEGNGYGNFLVLQAKPKLQGLLLAYEDGSPSMVR